MGGLWYEKTIFNIIPVDLLMFFTHPDGNFSSMTAAVKTVIPQKFWPVHQQSVGALAK
jgi:hypothetical protein